MLPHLTLIERFTKGATGGSASNLYIEDDVIYSYGHHFPLAIRQDWGQNVRYLINGDRNSVSTSTHQNLCIQNLEPNVQVPFSALESADLTDYPLPKRDLHVAAFREDEFHRTCNYCGREVNDTFIETDNPERLGYYHLDDSTPLCAKAEDKTDYHHILGAVILEHKGRCYLSSIDEAEGWRRRAYFLCQLPREVTSVEDAFDSLIPEKVRSAKAGGLEVKRQGDIFLVASPLQTRQIQAATERNVQVFNTTHVATEARANNGTVYVRGTLRHQPEGRRPQHAMLRLGNSWWIAIKNLALASWNAAGFVD